MAAPSSPKEQRVSPSPRCAMQDVLTGVTDCGAREPREGKYGEGKQVGEEEENIYTVEIASVARPAAKNSADSSASRAPGMHVNVSFDAAMTRTNEMLKNEADR